MNWREDEHNRAHALVALAGPAMSRVCHRTEHHEAAHAVIGHCLGMSVGYVSAVPVEAVLGVVILNTTPCPANPPRPGTLNRGAFETDRRAAIGHLHAIAPDASWRELLAMVRRTRESARLMVAAHRRVIDWFAEELSERGGTIAGPSEIAGLIDSIGEGLNKEVLMDVFDIVDPNAIRSADYQGLARVMTAAERIASMPDVPARVREKWQAALVRVRMECQRRGGDLAHWKAIGEAQENLVKRIVNDALEGRDRVREVA